ncbi:leucine-rich repeat domain-containing protein [Crateriforma spongiae]|uniref:leucine-rich repeat domain-containing protein n=1 Tax=Crateriforma spongiae TaxID=2724528 RepID=UPI001447EBA5|nr:hypothetical protein [Crateriforma spongiae]
MKPLRLICFSSLVTAAMAWFPKIPADDTIGRSNNRQSISQQLIDLGAGNVRQINGQLSYVHLKGSRFTDDAADLLAGQRSLVFLSLAQTPITDATLRIVCDLGQLKWLFLDHTKITDQAAVGLGKLSNLRTLSLAGCELTDKTFSHVSWPRLHTLDLSESRISDTTVGRLSGHQTIQNLNLSQTGVTDRCMNDLVTMPKITRLNLAGTKITDAGFAKLKSLGNLRELDVTGTQVTASAILGFSAQHPECLIHGPKLAIDSLAHH